MTIHDRLERHDVWWLFDAQLSDGREGLDRYLVTLLGRCIEWFAVSGASMFLIDDRSGEYRLACKGGSDSTVPEGSKIVPGRGIAGICIETRRAMLIADPRSEPELAERVTEMRAELGTAIVVPLIAPDGEVIGVLNLARKAGMEPFSPTDEQHVESLCAVISLAVNNARQMARKVEALQETDRERAKLKAIVESLGVGMLVTDAGGQIAESNGAANELFGNPPKIENGPEPLVRTIRELRQQAKLGKGSHRIVHDTVANQYWSIVCTKIGRTGAVTTIADVSEHEQGRHELEKVRYLAEIGKMTAAIAHEIRNPLTGIQSAAQLVQEAPAQAVELGRIIEVEARKLNELCNEFLDFSKPVLVRPQQVRLRDLISTVNRHHLGEFDAVGVRLVVQNRNSDPILLVDAHRFEQVYRNLLLNALQASSEGGTVTVRLTNEGFSVMDTGHGIETENKDKIFTPFFTTKSRGSGLGLSIVSKIVLAHGGEIAVSSEVGQGANFEVRVPSAVAA